MGLLRPGVATPFLLLACAVVVASPAAAGRRPVGFVKACGSLTVARRHLKVDIGEGKAPMPCRTARRVMRRFLETRPTHRRPTARFLYVHRQWDCYVARLDGEGWDYHCITWDDAGGYVDVAAGRRW